MRVRTKITELVGYGLETKRPVIGCGRRTDRSVWADRCAEGWTYGGSIGAVTYEAKKKGKICFVIMLRFHAVKDFVNVVLKNIYFIRGLTQGSP